MIETDIFLCKNLMVRLCLREGVRIMTVLGELRKASVGHILLNTVTIKGNTVTIMANTVTIMVNTVTIMVNTVTIIVSTVTIMIYTPLSLGQQPSEWPSITSVRVMCV